MASAIEALIPLQNGPTIPESVVTWLLQAEDRGLRFSILPDGRLFVGPRGDIGAADDQFIRRHRDELLACVAYIEHQVPA